MKPSLDAVVVGRRRSQSLEWTGGGPVFCNKGGLTISWPSWEDHGRSESLHFQDLPKTNWKSQSRVPAPQFKWSRRPFRLGIHKKRTSNRKRVLPKGKIVPSTANSNVWETILGGAVHAFPCSCLTCFLGSDACTRYTPSTTPAFLRSSSKEPTPAAVGASHRAAPCGSSGATLRASPRLPSSTHRSAAPHRGNCAAARGLRPPEEIRKNCSTMETSRCTRVPSQRYEARNAGRLLKGAEDADYDV